MGRYWKTDEHGFLQNDARADLIQPEFTELLREVVAIYERHVGNLMHSLYVTGDLARGLAVPGQAELYVFAVFEPSADPEAVDDTWLDDETEHLTLSYKGLLSDVVLETWAYAYVFEEPERFSPGAFTIKTESVCLWGNDLSPELPDYDVKKEAVRQAIANENIVQIGHDLTYTDIQLKQTQSPAVIASWCAWISKRLLRAAWSLAAFDQAVHSRDLDLAAEVFSARYPDHAAHIQQAWRWSQHPAEDKTEVLAYLENFGSWLRAEAERWLDQYNPERHLDFEFDDDNLLE
ncbi:MAG: hypothetical protein OHK0046_04370 [Anaerolineae bacterium]